MVLNEYFGMGKVCQYRLIKSLKDFAYAFCEDLLGEMLRTHAGVNHDICTKFEEVNHDIFLQSIFFSSPNKI